MIANLIAGHWRQPHAPTLPVYNPATEEVLDEVPLSGPTEVAQAVAAVVAHPCDGTHAADVPL
jgi:malonate-semialdehyde dehydrogenase (acetylating) / methylmalonate-semialdehyde dehydrogenase